MAERVKASFLRQPWSYDHGFNPHPGHFVAFLNKTLYDDYLCLVALNKQQIYVGRSQKSTVKLGKWSTPKRVRIRPNNSTTVAFSWKEDKDASINQGYCVHRVSQKSRTKANSIVCDKLFSDWRRKNYSEFFLNDFISPQVKADRNR